MLHGDLAALAIWRTQDGVSRRLRDRGRRCTDQVASRRTVQTAGAGDSGRVGRVLSLGPRDGEHAHVDCEGNETAETHKGDAVSGRIAPRDRLA